MLPHILIQGSVKNCSYVIMQFQNYIMPRVRFQTCFSQKLVQIFQYSTISSCQYYFKSFLFPETSCGIQKKEERGIIFFYIQSEAANVIAKMKLAQLTFVVVVLTIVISHGFVIEIDKERLSK